MLPSNGTNEELLGVSAAPQLQLTRLKNPIDIEVYSCCFSVKYRPQK